MDQCKGSSRTVGEITLETPIILTPESTVESACKMMAEKKVDSVLVVDKSGDGARPEVLRHPNIVGIVTSRDVVYRLLAKGCDAKKTTLKDVMTSPVKVMEPSTTLYRVALTMNEHDFRQVPVMDSHRIMGVATSRNINMTIIKDIIGDIKVMATIFR